MPWLQIQRALCGLGTVVFGVVGVFFLWIGHEESTQGMLEVGFEIPFLDVSNGDEAVALMILGLVLLSNSLILFYGLTRIWGRIHARRYGDGR